VYKRQLVECVNCKNRRVIRESDLATKRVSVCPVCKNQIKEGSNETQT